MVLRAGLSSYRAVINALTVAQRIADDVLINTRDQCGDVKLKFHLKRDGVL